MQLSFDFYYDDEFETYCEEQHLSHSIGKVVLLIPEMILILDTLLKFITGFYVDGVMIVKKSHIMEHYLKKGLIFDLFAYCPVIIQGLVRKQIEEADLINETMIRILQLLMFCKVKRVAMALSNFQEIIASNGKNDYLLNALRLFLAVAFITHLNACAWHAIAYFSEENSDNWLYSSGLIAAPWSTRYWASMYWSVSMMVTIGYNSIAPTNSKEYMFGVFSLAVSVTLFGYTINSLNEIFNMISKQEKNYKFDIFVLILLTYELFLN